jgi:pimeloyl-ACP methyl ester carboxylesterase
MLKRFGKVVLSVVLLVVIAVAAFSGYRAWRQHEGEQALAITTPRGIDEGLFVPAPSGEQWITIRGTDRGNPVLLIVHGGPGAALSPLATEFLPFEQEWTVVQWDQPGAGRTFARAGDTLSATTTVASIAADGVAMSEFVSQRLGTNRVVLLGLSFGSVVGLEIMRARPDLFAAYVGTGLFVHRDEGRAIAYDRVLARARARDDATAMAELEAIGRPPQSTPDSARTLNRWIDAFTGAVEGGAATRVGELLFAPRQSLGDFATYFAGYAASDEQFDLGAMDLRKSGTQFARPIFIIQGAEDYDTPIELARSYFESITAPSKEFVALPNGGHTALVYDSANFLAELNARVLPLALARAP